MKRYLLILIVLCVTFYTRAQNIEQSAARQLVASNIAGIGLSENQLSNFIVSNAYYDKTDNIQRVYLLQSYKGLPVYNQMIVLAFRNDKLISRTGKFIDAIDSVAEYKSAAPLLTSTGAVQAAFAEANVTVSGSMPPLAILENGRKINYGKIGNVSEDVTSELLWIPVMEEKNLKLKLAWQVLVAPSNKADYWLIQIDAANGSLINKINLTVSDKWNNPDAKHSASGSAVNVPANNTIIHKEPLPEFFNGVNKPTLVGTANYLVIPYPAESPIHPGGTAAIRTNPWTAAPGNATSLGWHNDGTNDYTITRGNNVWATEDRAGTNTNAGIITPTGIPATSTTAPDPLNFNFPPDYSADPTTTAPAANNFRQFAITNLFYWSNIMHDVTYQYGFTEAAANFQANNQGRGGNGNDYVIALAESAAEGSIGNNANFTPTADGSRGRMRMYLFATATTLHVNSPAAIAGNYNNLEGAVSTNNLLANVGPVTGQVVYFNDDAGGATHYACGPPANSVSGKIALINRGFGGSVCTGTVSFVTKIKAAQDAGAIAVIMVNNVPGALLMGGSDNTITIPAVAISDVDGAILAAQLGNNLNVTLAGAIPVDGDLDAGVMCHEYGHGVSHRLTGGGSNPSCLGASASGCANTRENGDEGWSDYMGLMMTTNWATAQLTDGGNARPIGTYVNGGSGFRIRPYSTNLTIDPATYANMGDATYCSEIHNIGEIWCAAIWDMTWNIIQQQGAINPNIYNFNLATTTGGNSIALKLVLEGMKLQPCSPGFIDQRNAILTADANLYGGSHYCAIWNAFARRGMGWSASQGSSNSCTDQTPAFDLPPTPAITAQPASASVCVGANVVFTIAATGGNLGYNWQVSTNGGVNWNNVSPVNTTASLTLTAVTAGMNNNQYRCVLTGGCAPATVNSNAATLLINSSVPVITAQPANTSACAGTNATFTVAASGVSTYNWQVSTNGGANWNDVTPAATTTTLTLTGIILAMNGNQFRCVVTGGCGGTTVINSNAATLTITTGSVTIGTNPVNTAVCAGTNATFSVAATGASLTYNWQVSTDGGANWNNVTPAATTNTLTLTGVTAVMNNNQYRCVVNGTSACPATGINSNAALLTVNTSPAITTQPQDITLCTGANNTFSVTATGTNITYQWQISTDGGANYNPIGGATASTFTVNSIIAAMSGNRYRCVVSGACAPVATSTGAILTVVTSVTVSSQPVNVTICDGANASFTVAGNGSGIIYQWQLNTGSGFVNVPAAAPYSGGTSATLTITGATPAMNTYQYRAQLSNASCTTPGISNAATLTVNSLAVVSANPQGATICIGSGNTFSVTASGTGITYQWQISTAAVPAFTNIAGATASTYIVSGATAGMNGNQYRCIVSGTCTAATSAAATLAVITPLSIATQPANAELCSGTNAVFTVAGNSTQPVIYQWEVSTNGGTTWTSVSGANAATLTVNAVTAAMSNNRYRAQLSNATCPSPATSNAGILTVRQLPTVGLTATSTSLSPGQSATLTATPTSSTGGVLSTTWTYNNNPLAVTGNTYVANVEKTGAYQARILETWPSSLACSSLSQVVTIDAPASSKLFIFPSPNDGTFTVSYYNSGSSTSRTITLYDTRGAKVEFKQFTATGPYTLVSIDIKPAQKGVYYVVVRDAAGKTLADGKVAVQ